MLFNHIQWESALHTDRSWHIAQITNTEKFTSMTNLDPICSGSYKVILMPQEAKPYIK